MAERGGDNPRLQKKKEAFFKLSTNVYVDKALVYLQHIRVLWQR